MIRKCDNCNSEYNADERNVKRGWGLCCSKSCAASKREKSKPGYNADKVAFNNMRREYWNTNGTDDSDSRITGYTSEGYRIIGGVAYDEFDDPVYTVSEVDEMHPHDGDNF